MAPRSWVAWIAVIGAVTLGIGVLVLAADEDGHGRWLAVLAAAFALAALQAARHLAGRTDGTGPADQHIATIEALARAIEARDQTEPEHVSRVQQYAVALARAMELSEADVQSIRVAALIHDIGMLAVPEHILSKREPLTPEEFQKIRNHPRVGAELTAATPYPRAIAPLIRGHHERWDGLGYPDGLHGEAIPLGARIIALAEHFDAVTADRPYHTAMPIETAVKLLHQDAGGAFDPALVSRFVALLPGLVPAQEAAGGRTASTPVRAPAAPYRQIASAHHEIYLLWDLAQSLGTSIGLSDTMRLITGKLTHLVPYDCCALFLPDDDAETLRCRFAWGRDAEVIERVVIKGGKGLSGWVARTRQPLVNGSPRMDTIEATALQSALIYPLVFHDRFVGTLALYSLEADSYTEEHCRLLARVAGQISAVIANSRLFDQAQEDSLTDPLTGLPNTRSLFMHMTRELARAGRLQSTVAMLLVDVDDFKQINDRHGHHVGDRALCEVSRMLRATIRPYDICVRYAGDEFILVLSGCSSEEASRKRVELQKTIHANVFESRPGLPLRLGVSVGLALYPDDGATYEALLAAADRRMYTDKSRRKRMAGVDGAADPTYSETEVERSSLGVL